MLARLLPALQLHHHGFQPEMEGYTVGDVKSLLGVTELAAAATTHMLAQFEVIGTLQRLTAALKYALPNATLRWHDSDRRR